MAQDFTMPKLGLTMTDGTIREWLVAEGTMVQAGDPVLIIETDKVETEVEAREAGVLTISGQVGENYECGAVIGQLLAEGEVGQAAAAAPTADAAPPAQPAAPAEPATQTAVPTPTAPPAPVESAPAERAAVPTGARAKDVAARGEHDRILASPMARAAARDADINLAHIAGTGPCGRIVADDVDAHIATLAAVPAAAATTAVGANAAGGLAARGEHDRILASPMARAAARDMGVDLATVSGTGPDGRIVAEDVQVAAAAQVAAGQTAAAEAPAQAPASPTVAATPAVASVATTPATGVAATGGARMLAELLGVDLRAVPASSGSRVTREDVAIWVREQLAASSSTPESTIVEAALSDTPLLQEPTTVVPLRGMRGVIAERMHASLSEMAQLTLSVDADMTAVNELRTKLKVAGGSAPGYTAWVIAAAAQALGDHPYANSQVTSEGVAYLPDVHIGVAVALDDGLIVPVIEHSNMRDVEELHSMVADLAGRARDGKLKLDELQGGTFSVTALGMYGVDMFTPVINPPNSAILGVGRLRTETMWSDGVPSPRTVMTLSLTWDHRAFDGAPAAEFAQSIVRYLENPAQLSG